MHKTCSCLLSDRFCTRAPMVRSLAGGCELLSSQLTARLTCCDGGWDVKLAVKHNTRRVPQDRKERVGTALLDTRAHARACAPLAQAAFRGKWTGRLIPPCCMCSSRFSDTLPVSACKNIFQSDSHPSRSSPSYFPLQSKHTLAQWPPRPLDLSTRSHGRSSC